MLVSPADFAAFSEATGAPYPASTAEKAQLLPVILDWKAAQQQEQAQNRGPNLLAAALAGAGTIGLGAGAYGIYQKLRKQGISEPVAADIAAKSAPAAPQPVDLPPAAPQPPARVSTQRLTPQELAAQISISPAETPVSAAPDGAFAADSMIPVRRDKDGKLSYALGALFPGNRKGTAHARGRGEYQLNSLWNDPTWGPLLHAANTPDLQQSLVAQAQEHNSALAGRLQDAINLRNGSASPAATYVKSEAGLPNPRSVPENAAFFVGDSKRLLVPAPGGSGWADGSALGARARLAASDRAAYGTASASDLDSDGNPVDINAPKGKTSKGMLRESYLPPDENDNASIFVSENDLSDRARQLGAFIGDDDALYLPGEETADGGSQPPRRVRFGSGVARHLLNRPIAGSDLGAYGEQEQVSKGFSDREDSATKGMYEKLPASSMNLKALRLKQSFGWDLVPAATRVREDGTVVFEPAHYEERPYTGGVYTGKTFSEVAGAEEIPDSDSYIKKDLGTPLPDAARRLIKISASGVEPPPGTVVSLAREYGVAPDDIEAAAGRFFGGVDLRANSGFTAPHARAVGGKTHSDWLTQALSAMQVTKPADSHTINNLLASESTVDRATAAQSWLNANQELAQVLSSQMPGTSATERISLVQEALNDAADDYHRAIDWAASNDPELAPRLTPGAKGFPSFDQFARPYVRKHVLGSALELSNAGGGSAPVINLPADVAELIANEAITSGTPVPELINQRLAGVKSPVEAVWKLDGILANAASQNLDEPYTVGSKLAERFWDAAPADDSSRVGRLKDRLTATSQSRYAQGDPLNGGSSVMPIAVKFGSRFPDPGQGFGSLDQSTRDEVITAAIGAGEHLEPNKVLKNETATAKGAIKRAAAQFKDGLITESERDAAVNAGKQALADATGRQDTINSLRLQGEKLISRLNNATRGRGFLIDNDPASGNALIRPDDSLQPASLERLTAASGEDNLPSAVSSSAGGEEVDATVRAYNSAVGPMAPGEADRANAELRRQRLNRQADTQSNLRVQQLIEQNLGLAAAGPQPSVRLSTPEHAFNTAKAHFIRANTLQPTPIGTVEPGTPLPPARTSPQPAKQTPFAMPDQVTKTVRNWDTGDMHLFPDGTAAQIRSVEGSRSEPRPFQGALAEEKPLYRDGRLRKGMSYSNERIAVDPAQLQGGVAVAPVTPTQVEMSSNARVALAPPSVQAQQRAMAGAVGDYWDKVIGSKGFRPKADGSPSLNGMQPFVAPSPAGIQARINGLRRRGIL